MNLNRIHDYCTSLAVSAMLTSAFLATAPEGFLAAGAGPMGASAALQSAITGLRADGWHGTATLALPTTITAAQTTPATTQPESTSSPFTEIQFKKITQYWDTRKNDVEIIGKYSRLLGLTKGDETIRGRKMGGRDKNDDSLHTFIRLNNGAGYWMTREPRGGEAHVYWVSLDFKLIAAISASKDNGETILTVPDAEKELPAEYARWAEVADGL